MSSFFKNSYSKVQVPSSILNFTHSLPTSPEISPEVQISPEISYEMQNFTWNFTRNFAFHRKFQGKFALRAHFRWNGHTSGEISGKTALQSFRGKELRPPLLNTSADSKQAYSPCKVIRLEISWISLVVRPWSVDSLNGRSTDVMKNLRQKKKM